MTAPRVDTQAHVVSSDHDRYPLNPPPAQAVHGVSERWFDAPALAVEDLLGRMDATGIDRAVLVQAFSAYQYDNRYTAEAVAVDPARLASVCLVDVEHDTVASIRHWVGEGARGIRMFVRNASPGWLGGPVCDDVFTELARHQVVAQVVATGDDLPALLDVARRHPDVPVLVDHCAMPDLSGGDSFPNAATLFALAASPNVHVKLSSHVFSIAERAGSSATAIAQRLVREFGAERVMWASDYSVLGLVYADCVDQAEQACAPLAAADRDLVLGGSALRMWWPA